MKKMWILIVMAAAIITSCGQEILDSGSDITETAPIVFNLTANHPDATKAVKTGWEAGDAIFVFFSGAAAPKHLKMTYDGSKWTSAEYDGSTQTKGALGLANGNLGTMRAVFLPFGSDATVSASGTDFVFSKTYYAYYLTATLDYTVSNGKVSGAFQMEIPEGYVQFFVEDAAAQDEAYLLGCDAVIPTGVASISANGTITETSDKTAANDMPGYAYSGGYLFSGKLGSWGYGANYYFAKTKSDGTVRHDYFVTGKTLSSHSAVKLPENDNVYIPGSGDGKWIPVGPERFVNFYNSSGGNPFNVSWATCNYGASFPEERGSEKSLSFEEAVATQGSIEIPSSLRLPSKDLFSILADQTHTAITVHGKPGYVISAFQGFIFLPATSDAPSWEYWSGEEHNEIDGKKAWFLEGTTKNLALAYADKTRTMRVRHISIR